MSFNSKYKSSKIEEILDSVGGKQDAISDLESIRDGASKGATAVQPEDVAGIVTEEGFVTADDLAGVASSGNYNDLVDIPTFKTINGESILGSGNITIPGGSGGSSSSSSAKEFVVKEPDSDPSGNIGAFLHDDPLQPNKVYVFSQPIYSLYIAYINESMGAGDEYTIMFTSEGATSILIGAAYQVYWANGVIPTISNGDMCELSLVRIGSVLKAVLSIFKAE